MFKQTLVIVSLLSLFLVGCSSDQRYKREVAGNDSYLKSPELKPLIVPNEIKVPRESGEYHVYKAATTGNVGKDVDIRPPALPLSTVTDSYASYGNGLVKLDSPEYSDFWSQIPAILASHNVAIERNDNQVIKTGVRLINRADESQPVEASYLLQRQLQNERETITVELTSLKRAGQDVLNPIESQRYTVEFFNMLMSSFSSAKTQKQLNKKGQ